MSRRALSVVLLAPAALLALWLLGGERRGGARQGAVAAARDVVDAGAELVPSPPTELEPRAAGGRETVGADPLRAAPGAALERAAPEGVRLRGVLRFSSDRRPAPGETLAFVAEQSSTRVVTDPSGRFETEAVVPSGIVFVVRAAVPEDEQAQSLELEPARLLVREVSAGERVQEVELTLVEPDAWLRVQVFADGVPTPATLKWSRSIGPATCATDAEGRGEMALNRLEPGDELSVRASTEDALSMPAKRVFPWPDELVRLELEPAGRIRARVRTASGEPAGDVAVEVVDQLGDVEFGARRTTDEQGVAVLGPLLAGSPRSIRAGDAPVQDVRVPPGGEVELEFVLPPTELVAAGHVLDEAGGPLGGVLVLAQNAQGSALDESAWTDDDGAFEIRATSGRMDASVRVRAGGGADEEQFEPCEQLVRGGSQGLVFHRVASPPVLQVPLVALDARTRAPLREARFLVYRPASPDEYVLYGSPSGLQTCPLRPYDDVRIRASVVGYRALTIAWSEAPEEARRGRPLCFELEPGFEQVVEVVEHDTLEPIAGARIYAARALVATSDARGRAEVRLAEWPKSLRAEAAGFASAECERGTILCEPAAVFRLARRD